MNVKFSGRHSSKKQNQSPWQDWLCFTMSKKRIATQVRRNDQLRPLRYSSRSTIRYFIHQINQAAIDALATAILLSCSIKA